MSELRLFPLQTVLFPGMALPLHVFEDRYRQLISECLEASEPFGVALIREGVEVGGAAQPHEIGTTARIESVRRDDEGRLQLLTIGERRFRILQLHDDRPYLWAEVEYPEDEPAEVPQSLLEQAREHYASLLRLRLAAGGEYVRDIPTPSAPELLADAAGAALTASPHELQRLLATIDVGRRLEQASALLEAAIPAARRDARMAVARRSGGSAGLN